MSRLCIVVGTRPEIIKMAPVILECQKQALPFFIIHTNQHYSREMDAIFFEELQLPQPAYNLGIGSGTHGEVTGASLSRIEKVLMDEEPSLVLVQGDTNSALAGALAAAKLHIPVGHVEAGLRSYDRSMPEEINRVLIDHIADYLFAPTQRDAETLRREGLGEEKIFVAGNTIVDVLQRYTSVAQSTSTILSKLDLHPREYILVTAHRQENVDDESRLKGILEGLSRVHAETTFSLIYPIHPRTKKRIAEFELSISSGVRMIDPVGFFDFLNLESNARLCITDSGGVQEESCILGVPCVTMRDNTERPQTLDVGSNVLAGTDPDHILASAQKQLERTPDWCQPFGDGHAAEQILFWYSECTR